MTTNDKLIGKPLQISLTVKELSKSVDWYTQVLGFTIDRKIERDGRLHGMAVSAGDVHIVLNQDDGAKGWSRVKGEGFSLTIVTAQNVDEIAHRAQAHGGVLDVEPKDMPWGARVFRLRDPDGYKWSVSTPRQG